MYTGLLHLHSFLRWILLLLLILAILYAWGSWLRRQPYKPIHNKVYLWGLILTHIQLIIGLILYFISPIVQSGLDDIGAAMENDNLRFWTIEHLIGMLAAITLITIGRVVSKKKDQDSQKHKMIALFYTFGLIIMVAMIPWERF